MNENEKIKLAKDGLAIYDDILRYAKTGYVGLPDTDPAGALSGDEKVLRGGNWFFKKPEMLSCAYRGDQPAGFFYKGIGFRLCMESFR